MTTDMMDGKKRTAEWNKKKSKEANAERKKKTRSPLQILSNIKTDGDMKTK